VRLGKHKKPHDEKHERKHENSDKEEDNRETGMKILFIFIYLLIHSLFVIYLYLSTAKYITLHYKIQNSHPLQNTEVSDEQHHANELSDHSANVHHVRPVQKRSRMDELLEVNILIPNFYIRLFINIF
jgi:hypothetical protein